MNEVMNEELTEKEIRGSNIKSFDVNFEQINKYSTNKRTIRVDCSDEEVAKTLILKRFKGIKNINQLTGKYQFTGKIKVLSVKEVKEKK
jgi:hypothetical protein